MPWQAPFGAISRAHFGAPFRSPTGDPMVLPFGLKMGAPMNASCRRFRAQMGAPMNASFRAQMGAPCRAQSCCSYCRPRLRQLKGNVKHRALASCPETRREKQFGAQRRQDFPLMLWLARQESISFAEFPLQTDIDIGAASQGLVRVLCNRINLRASGWRLTRGNSAQQLRQESNPIDLILVIPLPVRHRHHAVPKLVEKAPLEQRAAIRHLAVAQIVIRTVHLDCNPKTAPPLPSVASRRLDESVNRIARHGVLGLLLALESSLPTSPSLPSTVAKLAATAGLEGDSSLRNTKNM
eukprot:CAMPEP_0169436710 /NCGR_PEP_ID=MMETSP1042-20121227/5738_1 /TAXON_ID=464988 /ORGANISM="Hemiselmis andersenii, Strain CCMP1180" /LENGTH=295 /DNA_ID=CAMNT_0009547431 /DNA_START=54 /DNA_END=942 /DNA_ORIENTATION=-